MEFFIPEHFYCNGYRFEFRKYKRFANLSCRMCKDINLRICQIDIFKNSSCICIVQSKGQRYYMYRHGKI